MRGFYLSFVVAALAFVLAFLWAGWPGLGVCALMIALEVSFSFDNAVVNASVMRGMTAVWQRRFLTWGMLIATFGMYYLFPIAIVSFATGIGLIDVTRMAIEAPQDYASHLTGAHTQIAAFGGMFLLMVFLTFILNEDKEHHWIPHIERYLSRLGRIQAIEIIVALAVLLGMQWLLPREDRLPMMVAGTSGITLYIVISSFTAFCARGEKKNNITSYPGLMGFLYLNLLDASFSLDAVVGSFAISDDIVIIVLGLSAGAMFVRSLTLQLVRKGTLARYIYLEHGAHYAIAALAVIMLVSILHPVPEVIPGLIGIVFLLAAFWSSLRHNRRNRRN